MDTNKKDGNSLPLRPANTNPEMPESDTSSYEQRLAKLRDQMAKRETVLVKSQKRAHFAIGRVVMENSALRKLVAPHLERHLAKLGSARKAVDDYDRNGDEIAKLKALRL